MIIALSILITVIAINAAIQAYLIEVKGIWIKHAYSRIIAGTYILAIAFTYLIQVYELSWFFLLPLIVLSVLFACINWIEFDFLLIVFRNLYRPKDRQLPLNYIGGKAKDKAFTDLFLIKLPNPEYTQFIPKLLLLILTIFLYIKL